MASFGMILAGCGGGGAPSATLPTEDALRKASIQYWDDFKSNDAKGVYEALSQACRAANPGGPSLYAKVLPQAREFYERMLGRKLDDTEPGPIEITDFTPARALVFAPIVAKDDGTPLDSDTAHRQPWVFENGRWRIDDCPV